MGKIFFSPSTGGFYEPAINGDDIPADAIEITAEDRDAMLLAQSQTPGGISIIVGEDGKLQAAPPPPPSAEETMANNASRRDWLMGDATQKIAPLQDAVDLGMATPEEEAALLAWKRYRVELNRMDLTLNPVTWPTPPAV